MTEVDVNLDPPEEVLCEECGSILTPDGCPLCDKLPLYSHWSADPLILDLEYAYRGDRTFKPAGLWFDVDADWKRWCEAESFRQEHFGVRNVLTLDLSQILVLSDSIDIDRFTDNYGVRSDELFSRQEIQWERLKRDYSGIIIAPYCWERRMTDHTFWYYSWDCASGCVWDLSAVKTVKHVLCDKVSA